MTATTFTILCGTCRDRHATVAEVRECAAEYHDQAAAAREEIYAEAVMSWVMGGGAKHDASLYAGVIASGGVWNGGVPVHGGDDDDEECEHGLSARLCDGPLHYPPDDPRDDL
jgi:hypothetical protein